MKVAKVAPVTLDGRTGMDRIADELVSFTKSAQTINAEQSQNLIKILTAMIRVLEKIGQEKPVVVSKPTEWNMEVTSRDSNGFIEGVKLVSNNKLLN